MARRFFLQGRNLQSTKISPWSALRDTENTDLRIFSPETTSRYYERQADVTLSSMPIASFLQADRQGNPQTADSWTPYACKEQAIFHNYGARTLKHIWGTQEAGTACNHVLTKTVYGGSSHLHDVLYQSTTLRHISLYVLSNRFRFLVRFMRFLPD